MLKNKKKCEHIHQNIKKTSTIFLFYYKIINSYFKYFKNHDLPKLIIPSSPNLRMFNTPRRI